MVVTEASLVPILRRLIPGLSIYTAGNSNFQDCLHFYNHALDEQPLVCVKPVIDQEVAQVIQFCNTSGIPFSVRSGGHDFFGRSLVKGGVLIDMRAIDSIIVEPGRASARVGGGVIAGTLQESLGSQGLFTPTGQTNTVGYILGARVVLAGGQIVNTDQEPELLWALRGAGAGTFGIVTELRVKVYPVPDLYAGLLAFPLSDAAAVMDRIDKLLDEDFPDEFSGDAIAAHPEMVPIPVSEPCLVLFWCWTMTNGGLAPAKGFLDQMVQAGKVLGNTVSETTPAAYGAGDTSSPTFVRSRSIDRMQHKVGAVLARQPPPYPMSIVIFHNNHGKGVRDGIADEVGAVFANRYKHVILGFHGGTKSGSVEAQDVSNAATWVTELRDAIDQDGLSLQGGFPSFFPPGQVDLEQFFGAQGATRLRRLKARLDPDNIFCHSLPGLGQAK
ncbi:unnamed protein product [Penicillium nalgiovense]|nr:unnamed protein product [Penicillium nalgiovense]